MKIKIVSITDRGLERTNNEDAFVFCPDLSLQDWTQSETPAYIPLNEYGAVSVVADGMGGANAGDVASAIATESIRQTFSKSNVEHALKANDVDNFLRYCIKNADDAINRKMCEDPDTRGMGTTIVVCWMVDAAAHIAWCGDSRCYVFNPFTGLKMLTKDHSLVQELIDSGEITEKEAFTHPDNNIITRGLGDVDSQSTPDVISYSLNPNDTLLLCSDGLCGYCTNKEIERVMKANYIDVMKCRDELMKHALDSGGYDNICISIASIISDEQKIPASLTLVQSLKLFVKRLFGLS